MQDLTLAPDPGMAQNGTGGADTLQGMGSNNKPAANSEVWRVAA